MSLPRTSGRIVGELSGFGHRQPFVWTVAALILCIPGLHAEQAAEQTARADRPTVEHILNRVTFGPRPGDVDRVQAMGLDAYLESQLHPEALSDEPLEARLSAFATLDMSARDLAREYFQPAADARRQAQVSGGEQMMAPTAPASAARQAQAAQRTVLAELAQAKILRAVLSERQLQEVLTDFWLNHFNVFAGKGQVQQYLTEYERDVIRPRVFGTFRDLLGAVAHSPAMLLYLDNWQSAAPPPGDALGDELEARLNDPRLSAEQRRQLLDRLRQRQMQRAQQRPQRGLNENYARELMELHTLGVDGGYTQADVVALARILTGWTIDQPRNGGSFIFRLGMHDAGTKVLLGSTFHAAGQVEGEQALDLLAGHPSTARHISFKLAQRFVSDEPPSALVNRVAAVFTATEGDLRAVVRALLTSPELVGPDYRRAKVKTPLEFVASAVRATGATIVSAQPLVAALQNLGMPLYGCQPPTGYSMTADAWVNTGALLNRMNFAMALVDGGRVVPDAQSRAGNAGPARAGGAGSGRGARVGSPAARGRGPIQIDVRALAADTSEPARQALVAALFAAGVSEATAQTLARADTPQQLLALTLGSPEFQRR